MAIKELARLFTKQELLDAADRASSEDKAKLAAFKAKYESMFTARANQEKLVAKSVAEKLKRLKARRQGLGEESKPIDQNYTLVGEPRGELLGSVADVDEAVKVILANGGEAHLDRLQDTDYRVTKADFRSRLAPALLRECGISALSASMWANRTTGVYVKVKGSGNWILLKVGQAKPQ